MVSGVLVRFDDAVLSPLMKTNITEIGARWSKADLFLEKGEGWGEEKRREPRSHNPLQDPTAIDVAFFHYVLFNKVSTPSQVPNLRIKLVINTWACWRIFQIQTLVQSVDCLDSSSPCSWNLGTEGFMDQHTIWRYIPQVFLYLREVGEREVQLLSK